MAMSGEGPFITAHCGVPLVGARPTPGQRSRMPSLWHGARDEWGWPGTVTLSRPGEPSPWVTALCPGSYLLPMPLSSRTGRVWLSSYRAWGAAYALVSVVTRDWEPSLPAMSPRWVVRAPARGRIAATP